MDRPRNSNLGKTDVEIDETQLLAHINLGSIMRASA